MKRNPFKKNNKLTLGITCLAVLALFILFTNLFRNEVRGFFYWFSSPIQKNLWTAGIQSSNFLRGISDFASLENKFQESEKKNQGLTAEIIRLKNIERENEELRTALNIGLEKDFKLTLAQVISKDISEDTILINKGSGDGVSKNMAVITEEKVLVGRITEVFDKYSKVTLLSHRNVSFDVVIKKDDGEVAAVAQGHGNSEILINLIPQKEIISEGDIVVTSSLGGIFPESLMVGYVDKFDKNDVDPFQTAQLKNILDISQIKDVFVIE